MRLPLSRSASHPQDTLSCFQTLRHGVETLVGEVSVSNTIAAEARPYIRCGVLTLGPAATQRRTTLTNHPDSGDCRGFGRRRRPAPTRERQAWPSGRGSAQSWRRAPTATRASWSAEGILRADQRRVALNGGTRLPPVGVAPEEAGRLTPAHAGRAEEEHELPCFPAARGACEAARRRGSRACHVLCGAGARVAAR